MRISGTGGDAEALDELVEAWAAVPAIPGVILTVQEGGETLYAKSAGNLTRKDGGKLSPDTQFHRASVGQLFDKPETNAPYYSMPEGTEDPTFFFAAGPRAGLPVKGPKYSEHTGHWAVWFIVFPEEEVVIVATLAQSNADFWTFAKAVRRLASTELGF